MDRPLKETVYTPDSELLVLALESAAVAARALQAEFIVDAQVIQANGKDIKTQADLSAQRHILKILETSGIPILAEEGAVDRQLTSGRIWIVDPLDGTFNFSRGFPMAAVSIALWENQLPILGVVHDVFTGDVYSASIASGARLGKQQIQVSNVSSKSNAVLATGLPIGRDYSTDSLKNFVESLQQYKKVRMLGSAALMLTQVAAGRFDVYEEEDICLWDVAAGLALVKMAGGQYQLESGSGPFKYRVRASNGYL